MKVLAAINDPGVAQKILRMRVIKAPCMANVAAMPFQCEAPLLTGRLPEFGAS